MSDEQTTKKAIHRAMVKKIVDYIVVLAPGVGDTISKVAIAAELGEDPSTREFGLAFHAARDALVEASPSYVFKVKHNGSDGEFVRMSEAERSEKAGARYLRKARTAAYRGVRRVVRTDTSGFTADEKRDHERRVIQTSNAFFEVEDAVKRADPAKGGRWLNRPEADPAARPHFAVPLPNPPKPSQQKWLHGPPEPGEPPQT